MALIYGNKADAIFADTKWEHEELYNQLSKVENKIREFHGNDFKIIKIKSESYPDGLGEYIRKGNYYPSFGARFCTRIFKIEPIDNFLLRYKDEGATLMIGLNADEEHLRTGNYGLLPFINYTYPQPRMLLCRVFPQGGR